MILESIPEQWHFLSHKYAHYSPNSTMYKLYHFKPQSLNEAKISIAEILLLNRNIALSNSPAGLLTSWALNVV
jgi:hypothetical protein